MLFALSSYDARELALDFASAPPNETRREQELVICQDLVSDLLRRPHRNAEIQAFVNKYLRPLQERRSDAREDMEGERLIRMDYLDKAGLLGSERGSQALIGLKTLRTACLKGGRLPYVRRVCKPAGCTIFLNLVIATPYHDIASREWGEAHWVRSVDPFLLGFLKQVPELVFFLGR